MYRRDGGSDDQPVCTYSDAIVTSAQLLAAGTTRRAIQAGVTAGALVRLRRGVYARPNACADARAAAAHGGGMACVTAARHLGLWVLTPDERVHVGLGGHGHAYAHEACACVEHWEGVTEAFGESPVPRILRQILMCRGVEEFFVAVESALRLRLLSRTGLAWLHAHTNDAAREALAFAQALADSGLESLLRWRLRKHRLRIRSQVAIISVGVVDLLVGDRLIIEADGRENHDGRSKRHKDLMRDAGAAVWGYITLRFDYAMIVHDWETVESAILGVVERGLHLDP